MCVLTYCTAICEVVLCTGSHTLFRAGVLITLLDVFNWLFRESFPPSGGHLNRLLPGRPRDSLGKRCRIAAPRATREPHFMFALRDIRKNTHRKLNLGQGASPPLRLGAVHCFSGEDKLSSHLTVRLSSLPPERKLPPLPLRRRADQLADVTLLL